ncbi:MAG: hypothetical protein ABI626_03355 [Sphingomicrobium sp.]
MGRSLDLHARHLPDSRQRIDPAGSLEGMLLGGGIVAAMLLAQRSLASETRPVRAPQPLPVQR